MNRKIFLPILFLFIYSSVSGQVKPSCSPNMDFELGNLSYWNFLNGLAASAIPATTITVSPSPPIPGREDLMFGSGIDPYGFFPVVGAGLYSCRLGHDTINY